MIDDNKKTLEKMIDALGVKGVLELLAGVCYEKSDHIRESYNDKHLSTAWYETAIFIENTEVRV